MGKPSGARAELPSHAEPALLVSGHIFTFMALEKGSQLSKSGRVFVKSKGCTSPKPVKLFDFYI